MTDHLHIPIQTPSVRLLQISDCHVGPNSSENLLGMSTDESLTDVLNHITDEQQHPFDLLLATGDVSNNGGVKTYRRFLERIQNSSVQHDHFAWLPGNHDAPEDMNEALGTDTLVKTVELGPWLLILLNTQVPGHTHGNLRPEELDTLDRALSQFSDKHVLIFMHHQPVPIGCTWLDYQKVRNQFAFFKILDQYQHVKGVSWGHVHQEFTSDYQGVPLFSTPSTCVQFKPGSEEFAIDAAMPGYRTYELFDDGKYFTQVQRIKQKFYPVDYNSDGY